MRKLCLFTISRLAQSSQNKRWCLWLFAALLLCSGLFGATSPAYGAQKHGCAPDLPPTVSGNPGPAPSTPGSIVINEVLSQPHSTWNCSEASGVFSQGQDSWIELYNTQNQAFNLYEAHAEVSLDGGTTWYALPFGASIGPNGFLVIFPEEHYLDSDLNWKVILAIGSVVVDQAAVTALEPDQSYARVPDGSSTWEYVGQPTIDASNNSSGQPVTPTPTKTPKPTKTPGSGTTIGGGSTDTSNPPTSSGTQPAWSGVQLPARATPTPTSDISSSLPIDQPQPTVPAVQGSGGLNGWYLAMIIVVSLLLLGIVLWHRRLSRAP